MKAISRAGKIFFASLIFIMAIFIGNEKVFAADVDSFDKLQTAIENASDGETINVKNNITLDGTLVIDGKNITISGSGTISADSALENVADRQNTLFVIKNSTVKFNGLDATKKLTLDGKLKNRIIYSEDSKIELNNAIVSKGSPGSDSNINPGGGIF